jgi:ABC-2 type transport system ATP-binding protein
VQLKSRLGGTVVEVGFATRVRRRCFQGSLVNYAVRPPDVDGSEVRFEICEARGSSTRCGRSTARAAGDLAVREPTLDDVFLRLTGHTAEGDQPEADAEGESTR